MSTQIVSALRARAHELRTEAMQLEPRLPERAAFKADQAAEYTWLAELAESMPAAEVPEHSHTMLGGVMRHTHHPLTGAVLQKLR